MVLPPTTSTQSISSAASDVYKGQALNRINRSATTPGSGAHELATYFVGQVVGSINTVRPADRVVLQIVEEFIDTLTALSGHLDV